MNKVLREIDKCIMEKYNATCYKEILVNTLLLAKSEIERLLRGDFTPEEFQNLCHNTNTCDREKFEQGCKQYQDKLFGPQKQPFSVNQDGVSDYFKTKEYQEELRKFKERTRIVYE